MGQALIRTTAFLRKELVEIARQPRLIVTLVLGPFLILLLFGAYLRDTDPEIQTVFVAPEDEQLAQLVERFAESEQTRLIVQNVTGDEQQALERLRNGDVDLVVEFPDSPADLVRGDQRAPLTLYHNFIDPIETRALQLTTRAAVGAVNLRVTTALFEQAQQQAAAAEQRVVALRGQVSEARAAIERGERLAAAAQLAQIRQGVDALSAQLAGLGVFGASPGPAQDQIGSLSGTLNALDRRLDELPPAGQLASATLPRLRGLEQDLARLQTRLQQFQGLEPGVVLAPFTGLVERVVAAPISLTGFYAPAVVVLLVQHLVVTFISLSVVREEQLGVTELFRVSPLSSGEVLLGKFVSYFVVGGAVSAAVLGLLIAGLDVPMRGSWWLLAVVMAGLLLASVSLGMLLALLARSDSQAVQYAMLVLLATVFFSGFILTLSRFQPPLQALASVLPATYGIELLRDVMLRGGDVAASLLAPIFGIGLLLSGLSWLLLGRRLRQE